MGVRAQSGRRIESFRPLLFSVQDGGDLNFIAGHNVGIDVGRSGNNQFARPGHASCPA